MRFRAIYLTIAIFFFFTLSVLAQNKIDSLQRNLTSYAKHVNTSMLFVHFDKNVYTNNDQVWFTAYLLKSKFADTLYNTLYVSLISNQDSSVLLQESFLIQKGMAFGGFNLPDSLQTGDYRFVVNTNIKVSDKPDGEFIQPIYIKSTTTNPMVATVSVFKSYDEKTKNGTALFKALSSDNRFVPDAVVKYTIGNGDQTLLTGMAKTSVIGEVMINYPAEKITEDNHILSLFIQKGNLKRYLKFSLPYNKPNKYEVKFYPEGGYLVNGLESRVGFEIKEKDGQTVKAKAVLLENNIAIDTISTNSTGIGNFSVLMLENANYKIKLLEETGDEVYYNLPKALSRGIVTKLDSAVPGEDLIAYFQSNYNATIHVLVHNYTEIYHHIELNLQAMKMQKLRFKIDTIPTGLAAITVLDSNYMPIAERVFFAHQNKINQIEILPDKEEYSTRENVKLQVKINGKNVDEIEGVTSLVVTQSNRLSVSNHLNIVDYAYLQGNLTQLPTNPTGTKFNDLNYLENILLVKTWRKYKWPNEALVSNASKLGNFEYTGSVFKNDKPIKIPMEINVVAGGIQSFKSDSTGKFNIPFNLIVAQKGKVWLSLNSKLYEDYRVKLNNPFDGFKSYYKTFSYDETSKGNKVLNQSVKISPLSGIQLKDVTISNRDDETAYSKSNACGDYVCKFNILNCPNHFGDAGNRAPKNGARYVIPNSGGFATVYSGCDGGRDMKSFIILKGINLPKEFYVSDITNKDEPINFATIYWNYLIFINNKNTKVVDFNTGDLTGKFKIVVQGITTKGAIYGEKEITVNKR